MAVGNMTYHGGLVQHVQKVYTIFWQGIGGPAFPAGYQSTVNQFIQDLNQSSYYAIASQYADATGPISTSVVLAGTYLDTANPIPQPFGTNTDTINALLTEVEHARAANGWPTDVNAYFQVYTPDDIYVNANYCGFHTGAYFTSGSPAYGIGLVVYPRISGCLVTGPFPNEEFSDSAISVSAHEIMDTATDPFSGGWYFVGVSGEIGELCAWDFGTRGGDGGNLTLNGRRYVVQREWSNAVSGCSLGVPSGSPPVITVDPTNVTILSRQIASFSAAASGSPTLSVQWQDEFPGTSAFVDIPGATSTTYAFTATVADSGVMFRAVFTNPFASTATAAATLIVDARRVPDDLDHDGLTDLTVWRPGSGTWFTLPSRNGAGYDPSAQFSHVWGEAGDVPFLDDLDGDGIADLVTWRPSTGTWYWLTSSSGYSYAAAGSKQWGNLLSRGENFGDVPMLADMDGDGKADLVIWRASTGTWYWLTSSSGYSYSSAFGVQWGSQSLGDVPLVADIDGDGKGDLIVWRASTGTWFWLTSWSNYNYGAQGEKQWGNQSLGDVPLVGDIDGDGKADLIVWRGSTGMWFWLTSSSGYSYASANGVQWGNQSLGDVPGLGDYDGDGKADVAVWRASTGTWYWLTSSSNYSYVSAHAVNWGASTDIPIVK